MKIDINILLNRLLKEELEKLRKRFKPYKRTPFLSNEVTIEVVDSVNSALGYYINTKSRERQYKYTHKICITERSIDSYMKLCNWDLDMEAIDELKDTIRHELIHAFVFEDFEEWETIKNCHVDYSPIFLSCLYWGGAYSGHPYTQKFYDTSLFKEVKECKNYDQLRKLLMLYIFSLEETVRQINEEIMPKRELNIFFNLDDPGTVKHTYLKQTVIALKDNKKVSCSIECLKLGIGFLVDSNDLMLGYKSKFSNGALAKYHEEQKTYMTNNENSINITLITNID